MTHSITRRHNLQAAYLQLCQLCGVVITGICLTKDLQPNLATMCYCTLLCSTGCNQLCGCWMREHMRTCLEAPCAILEASNVYVANVYVL